METEMIDKLFLELSQFTQAKTERELRLEAELARLREALHEYQDDNPKLRIALRDAAAALHDIGTYGTCTTHEAILQRADKAAADANQVLGGDVPDPPRGLGKDVA